MHRDRGKKVIVNLHKQPSITSLVKTNHTNHNLTRQKTQRGLISNFNQNCSEVISRNESEHGSRLPSECSSKRKDEVVMKKGTSRGRDLGRGESRDNRSKGRSREKGLKESSLQKNMMIKRREEKKMLPTCSFKIKLS